MKRLVVSLAAALALMILVPTGAQAVGLGKTCGGFPGTLCDAAAKTRCRIPDLTGMHKGAASLPEAYSSSLRLQQRDV